MKSKINIGLPDRIVRLVVAASLGMALVAGVVGAPVSYVVAIVALALLVTAAAGFCPLYAVLRIRTNAADVSRG
jgi:hypothetical protein